MTTQIGTPRLGSAPKDYDQDFFTRLVQVVEQSLRATGSNVGTIGETVAALGTLSTKNSINDSNWSGTALSVANGGTGSTTVAGIRTTTGQGLTKLASGSGGGGPGFYMPFPEYTTRKRYKLMVKNLLPTVSGATCYIRPSFDGGTTWSTAATYNTIATQVGADGSAPAIGVASTGLDNIPFTVGLSTGAVGNEFIFEIDQFVSGGNYTGMFATGRMMNSSGFTYRRDTTCLVQTSGQATGYGIGVSTGNLTSWDWTLYGYEN